MQIFLLININLPSVGIIAHCKKQVNIIVVKIIFLSRKSISRLNRLKKTLPLCGFGHIRSEFTRLVKAKQIVYNVTNLRMERR